MIHVIASIRVRAGKRAEYLAVIKAVAPSVRREPGCIEYLPAVDLDAHLPLQVLDSAEVTIIEKWESREALDAHLGSAHMRAYREKVKDIIEGVSLKVLQNAP